MQNGSVTPTQEKNLSRAWMGTGWLIYELFRKPFDPIFIYSSLFLKSSAEKKLLGIEFIHILRLFSDLQAPWESLWGINSSRRASCLCCLTGTSSYSTKPRGTITATCTVSWRWFCCSRTLKTPGKCCSPDSKCLNCKANEMKWLKPHLGVLLM